MKASKLYSLMLLLVVSQFLFAQTAPFIESIDSNVIPQGWSTYNDQGSTSSNSYFKFAQQPAYDASSCFDHTNQPGSHFAWVDGSTPYGNDLKVSLETDSIDVSTINQLWLDFYLFSYNVTYDTLGYNLFTVDFYDGTNWIDSIYGFKGSSLVPEWQEVSINLANYSTTGKVKVRFNVTKQNITPWYNDIAIDDIIIRDSCTAPLIFSTDTVAPTFIAFKVVNPIDSMVNLEYGPSGFLPGTGTFIASLNLVDTLTGLQSNTEYDIYLSNSCDTSSRIGPFTVRTDCSGPFGGNFTVGGPNADFPTLDRAIEELKYCGLSDSVNLYLQGGKHSVTQPLGAFPKFQLGYWVSIIGSGYLGDTLQKVGGRKEVLNLWAAKQLTLKNIFFDMSNAEIGVWMHQGCKDIVIDSCMAVIHGFGDVAFYGTSQDHYLSLGNNVSNLTVKNCTVDVASPNSWNFEAVAVIGPHSANGTLAGVFLHNNHFVDSRVRIDQMDSVIIHDNECRSIEATPVFLINCRYFEVKRNKLFAGRRDGFGLAVTNCSVLSPNQPCLIENNFISSEKKNGLVMSGTSRVNIVHNSIFALENASVINTANHIQYVNNISVSKTRYAFRSGMQSLPSNFIMDYNVFYGGGYYPLASWGSTDYNSLSDWQTAMPTMNMNSHEGNPEFYAVHDLHTHSILCNNKADSTDVNIDIDGDFRPMNGSTIKDVGADEYDVLNYDLKFEEFYLENAACGDSTMPVYVIVNNLGTDTIFGYSVTVEAFGGLSSITSTTVADTLPSEAFDTILVGHINTAHVFGSVQYKGFVNLIQDQFRLNDTLISEPYLYKPIAPVPLTMDSVCSSTPVATFLAQSNAVVTNEWFASPTDTIPTAVGDTVQLPVTLQQTYYLSYSQSPRDSLSTDNIFGQGVNGHGIMFNIHAKKDLTIDVIRVHTPYTFSIDTLPFELYYIANDGYQGNETNPSAWTKNDSTFLITYGFPWPIFNVYINPIEIKKGESYAFYLDYPASQTQTNRVPFNNDLVMEMGVGLNNSFGGVVPQIEFNGAIIYSTQACQTSLIPVTAPISSDSTLANFTYTKDVASANFTFDASTSQGDAFQWYFGDGASAGGQIATHHYTFNGQYNVCLVVRDTNCVGIDSICKVVNANFGVDENSANSFAVYPNPTSGRLILKFDRNKERTIRVYSVYGHLLQKTLHAGNKELEMIINNAPGIYLIEVEEDGRKEITRVVKIR